MHSCQLFMTVTHNNENIFYPICIVTNASNPIRFIHTHTHTQCKMFKHIFFMEKYKIKIKQVCIYKHEIDISKLQIYYIRAMPWIRDFLHKFKKIC